MRTNPDGTGVALFATLGAVVGTVLFINALSPDGRQPAPTPSREGGYSTGAPTPSGKNSSEGGIPTPTLSPRARR